jgi:hypothetical protein
MEIFIEPLCLFAKKLFLATLHIDSEEHLFKLIVRSVYSKTSLIPGLGLIK